MKNGWIKMHRMLLDSSIFADAELLRVFLYCLLQASYRVMTVPIGRQVITLQPGQLLYGRKAVSNRLGIGEGKLRGLMSQLEEMGILTIESSNRYSIVTVLQWDVYQNETDKTTLFPFDCDFLDEDEAEAPNEPLMAPEYTEEIIEDVPDELHLQKLVQDKEAVGALLEHAADNQQKSALLAALEAAFDKNITGREPANNHKQEEKNTIKIKESDKKDLGKCEAIPRAALRAVRRYRRADGEFFTKGKCESGVILTEGHSVPGGIAAVPGGNSAEALEKSHDELDDIHHDYIIEMQYNMPDAEQLTQMEYVYWQQYEWHHADECNLTLPADGEDVLQELNKIYEQERMMQQNQVELDNLAWDIDDDMNWGINIADYAAAAEVDAPDPDEQEWIAAHKLFNQLWNKYPVKAGKQKVSEAQIMELYQVGREAMLQTISNYKKKKHRVPKKYWMNGSTFFNGGYRGYL